MYEGAVDLEALQAKDEQLLQRVTSLIDNYGQVSVVYSLVVLNPCSD